MYMYTFVFFSLLMFFYLVDMIGFSFFVGKGWGGGPQDVRKSKVRGVM